MQPGSNSGIEFSFFAAIFLRLKQNIWSKGFRKYNGDNRYEVISFVVNYLGL